MEQFKLDDVRWREFVALLNSRPEPNDHLIRLMKRPPPWPEPDSVNLPVLPES